MAPSAEEGAAQAWEQVPAGEPTGGCLQSSRRAPLGCWSWRRSLAIALERARREAAVLEREDGLRRELSALRRWLGDVQGLAPGRRTASPPG